MVGCKHTDVLDNATLDNVVMSIDDNGRGIRITGAEFKTGNETIVIQFNGDISANLTKIDTGIYSLRFQTPFVKAPTMGVSQANLTDYKNNQVHISELTERGCIITASAYVGATWVVSDSVDFYIEPLGV